MPRVDVISYLLKIVEMYTFCFVSVKLLSHFIR